MGVRYTDPQDGEILQCAGNNVAIMMECAPGIHVHAEGGLGEDVDGRGTAASRAALAAEGLGAQLQYIQSL